MNDLLNATMQGINQGQDQARSITPNAAQPQGAPGQRNIICGSLKLVVDRLNEFGSLLNSQGLTQLANDLYKAGYSVNTVCEKLEKDDTSAGQ